MRKLPHGEKLPYWKTGKSAAGTVLERAEDVVRKFGGQIHHVGRGIEPQSGAEAFVLAFSFDSDRYQVVWPVLNYKYADDEGAARRQAATMLLHDVKAKAVAAQVFGVRAAFMPFLEIDGRPAFMLADDGLRKLLPARTT